MSLLSRSVLKHSTRQKGVSCTKAKYSENHYLEQYLKPEGNFRDVNYLDYVMPGSDEKRHTDFCGKWSRVGCLNVDAHQDKKAFLKQFRRTCYVATCPVCAEKWMARLAKQSDDRLKHAVKKYNCKLSHVMISIPSWLSHKPIKELRKMAYVQLKAVGVTAGNMMFHAYRKKVIGEQIIWYFSPHFHGVMTGWIYGVNVADEYRSKGWIVKKIRTLESNDEVFPLMLYQLSHSSISQDRHSLTWFGDFSYGKLKIEKDIAVGKCPECKSKLVVLELTDKCLIRPDEEFEGLLPFDWVFEPKVPGVRREIFQ